MERNWLLALALAGCSVTADNQNSLVVLQNQVIDPQMTMCKVPTTATTSSRPVGTLDVGLVQQANLDGYFMFPLVRNDLLPRANPMAGMQQTDTIELSGAEVQLNAGSLSGSLAPSQAAFFLDSFGGTIDPGLTGAMTLNIVPRQVALQLAAGVTGQELQPPQVIAHLRVHGNRSGGDVTSGWIDFPVNICKWCLTGGPPQACPATPPSKSSVNQGGCLAEQDDPISCCISGTSTLLCGSAFPTSGM